MQESSNELPSESMVFLMYDFQAKLEEADQYYNLPSDESKPYDNKYTARKILDVLLSGINSSPLEKDDLYIAKAITEFYLGVNFFETEESHQAEKHLSASLQLFAEVSKEKILYFYNYIQELYNTLGILYTNKDDLDNGLSIFAKAEDLFSLIKTLYAKNPIDIVNTLSGFDMSSTNEKFQFFFQGGLNMKKANKNYTLTLFYMAQAYTKAGLKFKAAQYCGWTLKRQYETKDYELKDWCMNCLSLAEFYDSNQEYAQGQYLLMAGLSLVPEAKEKLRCTFHMALGHHLLDFLQYIVEKQLSGNLKAVAETNKTINTKAVVFEGIGVDFVDVVIPIDLEGITTVFRQVNTQYKKALKHFVLDGFVTEYVQIVREISKGYRLLTYVEKDSERVLGMLEKRRELLELPQSEINPKAFENYWQLLTLELGEIYNEIFEKKYESFIRGEGKISGSSISKFNAICMKSIEYFEKLIQSIMESSNKELLENDDTVRTVITSKFNVAKNLSRYQTNDQKQKIETLVKSMEAYSWIIKFIQEYVVDKGRLTPELSETMNTCKEMVALLPSKIDKVNHGLMQSIQSTRSLM